MQVEGRGGRVRSSFETGSLRSSVETIRALCSLVEKNARKLTQIDPKIAQLANVLALSCTPPA